MDFKGVVLSLFLLPVSYPLCALEDDTQGSLFELGLDDLLSMKVVTAASGFEQSLDDAPASVTIIDAEEWQAMGATELFEALRHVPGLHITKMQTAISNNRPMVRGLSGTFGQQILLLIDGVPLRHFQDGGVLWGQRIPLNAFQRIEIIRSPGSAIYGADAVGGIINLVTYKSGTLPGRITARGGNNGTAQAELSGGGHALGGELDLAFAAQVSEGDRSRLVAADLQTQFDAGYGTNASLAPGPMENRYEIYSLRAHWQREEWDVRYFNWYNREFGTGAGISQALDPGGQAQQQAQTLVVDYDWSAKVVGEMNLKAIWHKVDSRLQATLFPAGSRLPVAEDGNIDFGSSRFVTFPDGVKGMPGNDDHAYALQLDHLFEPLPDHRLRWSVGYEHVAIQVFEYKNFGPGVLPPDATVVDGSLTSVTGTPYVYLPDKERDTYYLALQDQWRLSDTLNATLGARYDHYSDFGSTFNPRLGLVWQGTSRLTIKSFLGSAFRAPSFVDLYAQNNPAGVGNPDLKSESIRTLDGGFGASYLFSSNLHGELNLFQYKADNIIAFVPDGGVQRAQNTGELKVRGMEAQLSWRSGEGLGAEFNYSWLDDYSRKNVDVSAVPRQMANFTGHWHGQLWHWYLGAKWVADRERDSADTRSAIDDYVWADSRLELRLQAWTLGLVLQNLLNGDAREPSNGYVPQDYPLAGRQWLLDISYDFDR
jgi:outer membrane receptor for ferrienterochelin and colicins